MAKDQSYIRTAIFDVQGSDPEWIEKRAHEMAHHVWPNAEEVSVWIGIFEPAEQELDNTVLAWKVSVEVRARLPLD